MGYEEKRKNRISIFEDMIRFCEREQRLVKAIHNSREHTVIYKNRVPEALKPVKCWENSCTVDIWNLPALEAVQEMYRIFPDSRAGLLNLISPIKHSGEIMRGLPDQGQYLDCCTTLYPCLNMPPLSQELFSDEGKGLTSYRNVYIYTPAVVQIKTDKDKPEMMEQKTWAAFDVISCTVPDSRKKSGVMTALQKEVQGAGNYPEAYLENWFCDILQLAAHRGADILVLDVLEMNLRYAPSHIVETALLKALKQFEYCFRAVILPASFSTVL